MNDADEAVTSDADKAVTSDPGRGSARAISDAETLRALADPLRLRILSTLMQRDGGELPVRSVKELASALGEPQTKLYRHVKHLESTGLIKAVSSRVVSGIVEQRYQACQSELHLGTTRGEREKISAEAEAAAAAVLELFRSEFFAAYRSSLAASGASDAPERDADRDTMLSMSVNRVPRAKAAEIRARLRQVVNDLTEAESKAEAEGADIVTINVLLGCYGSEAGN